MGSQELANGSSNLNCPTTDSLSDNVAGISMCLGGVEDPFYSFLGNSSMVPQNEFSNPHFSLDNQTMGSSSHLVHFPSDSILADVVPKIPSFGSRSFSEMVSSFGRHSNFPQDQGVKIQENCQNSEEGLLGTSHNGKRKRKNIEVEQKKDQIGYTSELPEDDEKKNVGANSHAVKLVKDNSNSGEAPKENYIHVRAKRGQATNSHSLAERVRRERISERMRLLQELVPGCNKITGKAVMLDEIINYVQSLQQQVEFLSMKLATVNPELNVDIERILSKDILQPLGGNPTALGISPGLSSSHPFPGLPPGSFNSFPGTAPSFHPLPLNLWNNELQSILQMGFDSNPSVNGLSKMEQ
ncbi:hypothetical protein CDL12_27990 [Handroanthus impetiginosus]|uniref:BHLH domain-containing protein n=1 Tax=Handroanthus impetiginosus TaxID=429701 RepID=A0A2G9G2J4_9LAMI|nr:hypothetical protein CDL12_27990 [Handroanthus impetiginosus]